MDFSVILSIVIGVVSIVLALVAIWHSVMSERKINDNYNRTKDVLSKISEKAAVIKNTMDNTQEKLVDTITDIAKPQRETQEEMLLKAFLPKMLDNPQLLDRLIRMQERQERK